MASEIGSSTAKEGSDPKREEENDIRSSWFQALIRCLKETDMQVLDLSGKRFLAQEVKTILNILPESFVTELNLWRNSFENEITDLLTLLPRTKLKEFTVYVRSKQEFLQLLEVVKDSTVTNLHICCDKDFDFESSELSTCISFIKNSKLTTLTLNFSSFFRCIKNPSLVQEFLNTSITTLDLSRSRRTPDDLIYLFSILRGSSIVNLCLDNNKCSVKVINRLSERFRETKIEKLSLKKVGLCDAGFKNLVDGLVGSKVIDINLQSNSFSKLSPLFTKIKETQIRALNLEGNYLNNEDEFDPQSSWFSNLSTLFTKFKETQIRALNLSYNPNPQNFIYGDSLRYSSLSSLNVSDCGLSDEQGEALMESLRLSNVTDLNISCNKVGSLTVSKLADNINDINLTDLDISYNRMSLDAFFILGGRLKDSKLLHLDVSKCIQAYGYSNPVQDYSSDLISFLKLTEGSSIREIKMNYIRNAHEELPVYELNMLANTSLTELHLRANHMKGRVLNLLSYLKFMAVNHLNLSYNGITDSVAWDLAEYIKETQIRGLNLNSNHISSQGAKVLAQSLKDSNLLYLHLNNNKIENDGLEALGEHAKDTFMTRLEVYGNPGENKIAIETVLFENKISVHRLLSVFRLIRPEDNSDELVFDRNGNDFDISLFLEKSMAFYATMAGNPRATNVLLEEATSFSRERIRKLVFEEFPRQFSCFVGRRIEADVEQHVSILETAEEMGLSVIVESLLLNRPVYMLDEKEGILHPYVYKLLLKYKQPICSLALEPRGIEKIIEYFTKHANVEGAQDVIKLLRDVKIS